MLILWYHKIVPNMIQLPLVSILVKKYQTASTDWKQLNSTYTFTLVSQIADTTPDPNGTDHCEQALTLHLPSPSRANRMFVVSLHSASRRSRSPSSSACFHPLTLRFRRRRWKSQCHGPCNFLVWAAARTERGRPVAGVFSSGSF